ncbi:MAG TPA: PilZ domain-containing protein [Thermoanaerobaculia bacterium]|jgi:hypothetical protein
MSNSQERRSAPRYDVSLPVQIGETRGVTCNMSVDAVLFLAPVAYAVGSRIELAVTVTYGGLFDAPAALECRGVVARSDAEADGNFATAVTIETLRIVDCPLPPPRVPRIEAVS